MSKRKILTLLFISAGVAGASLAQADDGVVQFTGTISAAACTVSSVAGSGTTTGTVNFGQVSSASLSTAGSSTVARAFSIELTDCGVTDAPAITFNGTAVTTPNYTNLFSSQINGVGIRLEDAGQTGTYYSPGVAAANTGFSGLSEGVSSATGRFNAYLVSYNGDIPTGNIDTNITFIMDYTNA